MTLLGFYNSFNLLPLFLFCELVCYSIFTAINLFHYSVSMLVGINGAFWDDLDQNFQISNP